MTREEKQDYVRRLDMTTGHLTALSLELWPSGERYKLLFDAIIEVRKQFQMAIEEEYQKG